MSLCLPERFDISNGMKRRGYSSTVSQPSTNVWRLSQSRCSEREIRRSNMVHSIRRQVHPEAPVATDVQNHNKNDLPKTIRLKTVRRSLKTTVTRRFSPQKRLSQQKNEPETKNHGSRTFQVTSHRHFFRGNQGASTNRRTGLQRKHGRGEPARKGTFLELSGSRPQKGCINVVYQHPPTGC